MPYFKHKELNIHYKVQGEGIPFIFLHGLGGSVKQAVTHFQKRKNIQLITMDLRGNGKTPLGDENQLNFDTLADDVVALCHHLKINSCYIGGISMGAAVCMNLAVRHQNLIKGMILIRIAWLDRAMEESVCSLYNYVARYLTIVNGKEKFKKLKSYVDLQKAVPATAKSLSSCFDDPVSKTTAKKFMIMPNTQPIPSLNHLKKITVPVLIMANHQDPIHPYNYGLICSKLIPRVKFMEVISKSIDVNLHVQEVKDNIDEFFDEYEGQQEEC